MSTTPLAKEAGWDYLQIADSAKIANQNLVSETDDHAHLEAVVRADRPLGTNFSRHLPGFQVTASHSGSPSC